jgi:hypothetical protein
MRQSTFVKFLLSTLQDNTPTDPYWNNVLFLARLDSSNSKGLPIYKDYSKYQYNIRYKEGSLNTPTDYIKLISNGDIAYPIVANTSSNLIDSFMYLPNKNTRNVRIGEINQGILGTIRPSYFDVLLQGNPTFALNQEDFTIELSFYADDLNLPWKYQTLLSVGYCLYAPFNSSDIVNSTNVSSYISLYTSLNIGYGYGIFIEGDKLFFYAKGSKYLVQTASINADTWYSIAIQRSGNTLTMFVNGLASNTYVFNKDLSLSEATTTDTLFKRLHIGYSPIYSSFNSSFSKKLNGVETCFSGGLSNIRITKAARYPSSFYTLALPFGTLPAQNKLDSLYSSQLLNIPCSYDYFDYSSFSSQITDRALQKTIPTIASASLHLTGQTTYKTKNIATTLSPTAWCCEFFVVPYVNSNPLEMITQSQISADQQFNQVPECTWTDLFFDKFRVTDILQNRVDEIIPLFQITTSTGKKILNVDFNIQHIYIGDFSPTNKGTYFSCNLSSDGNTWLTFPSEINQSLINSPITNLPDEQIKFAGKFTQSSDTLTLEQSDAVARSAYSDLRYHIAIQRVNNNLYFFVNGVLNKTMAFPNTLYSEGNIEFALGGDYEPITARKLIYDNETLEYKYVNYKLSLGLSGIRVTNAARYSISTTNDILYENSRQPLALGLNALPPSRARILDIVRTSSTKLVSTASVEWIVYLNQDVSNLTVADFTLTQLNGLSGATITSLVKLNAFSYKLIANSGTGNGTLIPNFNDRKTVTYANTTTTISYFLGELSIEGEEYLVNKSNPTPTLTSGSNPYINTTFLALLQFDSPIATFVPALIGLVNCKLSKYRLINEENQIYELTLVPLKEGVISVQALQGTGITDSALPSNASNILTRVYKNFFPIVQLPLDTSNRFSDISPSSLILNEIIPNNTLYSSSEFPLGTNSSLSVDSLNEQSGFTVTNYNAVSGTLNPDTNIDWTIEFFLRVNSTVTGTTKKAHILSILNGSGICITASDGKLIVSRNPSQVSSLFSGVTWKDRATTAFPLWSSASSIQEKFPHFALVKKGNVYRFYVNGIRVGILASSNIFDITRGVLNVGYYPNNVGDIPYLLSNVRITYGKALYTAYQINVPYPPYSIVENISNYASVLNYISIYSNNNVASKARTGDLVLLKFNSIANLPVSPIVKINNTIVPVVKGQNNSYSSSHIVVATDSDGIIPFLITVPSQLGISEISFDSTTNNSFVTVDNNPLQCVIGSTSTNGSDHIFNIDITFSEDSLPLLLSYLTTVNCTLSNLYKYPGTNKYEVTVTGTNTGLVSIVLPANTILDTASNYNIQSNTFTRMITVPAYVPDPHWNNVTLLLQPVGTTITDSTSLSTLTDTNVIVSSITSPPGLSKSMKFSGNSSLNIKGSTLPANTAYTLEFFIYINSKTSLRLSSPVLNPANNLDTNKFDISWTAIAAATNYLIDIGTNAQFTQYVPGFKNKNTGLSTSITVSSIVSSIFPKIKEVQYLSDKGFILSWEYNAVDNIAYSLEIAKDINFNEKLSEYSPKVITSSSEVVGNLNGLQILSASQIPEQSSVIVDNIARGTGSIVTGVLKDVSSFPQIDYFLEESSLRVYKDDGYATPAIVEDVELFKWSHVALVNSDRYTYLYVDGQLMDKTKNLSFSDELIMGHNIGFFNGYITGVRITKGVKRYTGNEYIIPKLPYPTN